LKCRSCQQEAGPGPLCSGCGAIQPLSGAANPFAVLGFPETFRLDPNELEERFKDLSRKLHPDRFAQRSPAERRLSLEWTTAVNDAHRALKDPARRAAFLLERHGIPWEGAAGASAAQRRLSPEHLEEVLERREALAEARRARDLERVRRMALEAKSRVNETLRRISALFEQWEESRSPELLDQAGAALSMLKYDLRFQEEVEAIELEALELP
jgi:molecular chaperone HscB